MTDTVSETLPTSISTVTGSDAEIEALTRSIIAEINKGTMTLADLLKALSPKQESEPLPAVLPTAKAITPTQQAEIDKMPTVYGRVVPTERRSLEPVEVSALVEEKQTLDVVKKTAEARLKDITLTVHNHLDVLIEAAGTEGILRDGSGHYIAAGKAGAPDQEQEFSREVKNYAASLTEEGLADAEAQGLCTHEEYLAMTRQVRVVADEGRIAAALTKNPALVHAIRAATTPGKQGTAVALRKRK